MIQPVVKFCSKLYALAFVVGYQHVPVLYSLTEVSISCVFSSILCLKLSAAIIINQIPSGRSACDLRLPSAIK